MNPERTQDKQDAGEVKNYTRTANMLIFGYRNISPQEKWLYVCLKHLCGKRGTRHLALRYISDQTGISVGALSKSKNKQGVVNEGMIRHLHDAGLIHAEIKKKDGAGNAQYHITITDIWALNQSFFIKEECSEFGQDEEETVQPVRTSDEPVQNSDKLVRKSDEPVRKPVQYQNYSKTITKIRKQESAYSDAPDRDDQQDAHASAHTQFAFQVQGFSQFYHDFCIHEQDRGINDGLTLIVKNLDSVPQDAECRICYKPVHGAHGYGELPQSQDAPYQPDFTLSAKTTLPEIVQMSPVVDAMIEEVESRIVKPTISPSQDIVIPAEVVPAPQGYTQASTKAEQATLTAASRTKSAVMEPRQPRTVFSLPELSPKVILDAQIDQVLGWLDTVRIEAMKDARAGYVHTQTARKDIKGLIEGGAHLSQESVRANYLNLYNQPPDKRTGWDWKKKLTIRAFCNNFDNAVVCVSIPVPQPSTTLPSNAHLSDEEYYASLRRK